MPLFLGVEWLVAATVYSSINNSSPSGEIKANKNDRKNIRSDKEDIRGNC